MEPKVIVIVAGPQNITPQDYPIEIIQATDAVENTAQFFNAGLEGISEGMVICLSHRDNFTHRLSVSKLVERMYVHDIVGVLYSDVLMSNGTYLSPLYYPAFHPNVLQMDILINSPLCIKNPPKSARFQTSLEMFYNHDMLVKLGRKQFPLHVAHPIFTCEHNTDVDMTTEWKRLKQCLNQ